MAAPSSYRIVQTVNPAVSTGTITATPAALTLQGSLLLVFIGSSALTDTVSTVTDNGGNVYVQAYAIATGTGGNTELWYAKNATSTSSVVVTFSASTTTKSVYVREYAGVSANVKDQSITASGSGSSVSTGASASTSNADELVVCSCSCLGTSPTLSVGAGFGNFANQTLLAGLSVHAISDATVTSVGAQTGIMTAGGTLPVWDVGLATFTIEAGIIGNMKRSIKTTMSSSTVSN